MLGTTGISFHTRDLNAHEIMPRAAPPVWRMRYTASGNHLFAGLDSGRVCRFERAASGEHTPAGQLLVHENADIEDIDISITNDYLVTASRDHTVGVVRIGEPRWGSAGTWQMS